ncbi:hypothetical protein M378DRAFT_128508 [Amanita muscaria Koide BX008]|uniref:Uncharacterized protein n=1 Tax=Amanita muscaria (strain Koide BX008) TaxID=946122 RepID=A0A0C2T7U0_AMAMK|nr:hypothetical protein M378DRAFT_128508 [Amanita muscaria Koide BX008]
MTVNDPSAPRVARVVDYFSPKQQMAYLVMEFIDTATSADNAPETVADALQWLRRVPAPHDVIIGSVGGGPRHKLFRDSEAPLLFSSKWALQNYMNKVCSRCSRTDSGLRQANKDGFQQRQARFTQSDMDKSHFFIDNNGNMCILDFKTVVILPESFASYTMYASSSPFGKNVARCLGWPPSSNLESMRKAGAILMMLADETLGLDKDGFPRARH